MSKENKQLEEYEVDLEEEIEEDIDAESIVEENDEEEDDEEENKENPEDFEDVYDIAKKCIKCGLCKSNCPVYNVEKDNLSSPEGKMILLEKGKISENVYDCCLCGQCEKACPLDLKIREAILKARKIFVDSGKASKERKEMIEKLRKEGKI